MLCLSRCVDSFCLFLPFECTELCHMSVWFLIFVQMLQDCVWCTRLCIWSKWPKSYLPTYQHLTFRFVSDTRSWCCLVLQDTVMWPHMCVHLYTCDCNSVNVFWVRIHSRFRSEYRIAPIACQINHSKVWKYKVTNSYFGFENCADLVKLLIQSIIFCPGWWEHCPELQIPELGWPSIWVDQVWPAGQISTEWTISANSKWRKHALFANICAIKHMGKEEKQVKLWLRQQARWCSNWHPMIISSLCWYMRSR